MAFRHNSRTDPNEPAWGTVDKTELPRIAFAHKGDAAEKSTWKYPHHWVKGGGGKDEKGVFTTGTLLLSRSGLEAAWDAANGARSGEEASAEDKAHLAAHRKALGLDKEKKDAAGREIAASGRAFAPKAKAAGEGELAIYDEIDPGRGLGAKQFLAALRDLGDVKTLHLRINSPGGALGDATAIYNLLKDHPAHTVVHVDGMALSAASMVAMAGDEIEIADNAYMMIHNPASAAYGEADDVRHTADLLDKVTTQVVNTYAERTGESPERIAELMDAETWFCGEEAVANGFADRCSGVLAIAAKFDPQRHPYQHVPPQFLALAKGPSNSNDNNKETSMSTESSSVPATYAELKAGCVGADAEFLCGQLEAAATLPQAQAAWMAEQNKRLEAAKKTVVAAAGTPLKLPGVDALGAARPAAGTGGAATEGGDAIAAWEAALAVKLTLYKGDRARAVRALVHEQPQLQQEYIAAYNAARGGTVAA